MDFEPLVSRLVPVQTSPFRYKKGGANMINGGIIATTRGKTR